MSPFPRTMVGGVSVSRLVIGSNWFLGWSHCTAAKDAYIRQDIADRKVIAGILEVFFRAGVDTVIGSLGGKGVEPLTQGILDAEDRTGVKAIKISTPSLPVRRDTAVKGFDLGEVERILDAQVHHGANFILPHQGTTDAMLDLCSRELRQMAPVCKLIRERGMIPGLSTHMPQAIVYADETGLDVETYISIYNAAGFMMPLEVDWTARVIHNAKKPVLTIKPMAAGQLRPFQALHFVWNTLRPIDMVAAGTVTPNEAQELVDLSLQILEGRAASIALQETRSKASLKKAS